MRLLFFKHSLRWPRTRGHDVHTYFMMRALEQMGNDLTLLTVERPEAAAVAELAARRIVTEERYVVGRRVSLAGLQERFRSYWGVSRHDLGAFAATVDELHPDAVIATGPEVLPYLSVVRGCDRVWYAADDLCWQHLTQVSAADAASWANVQAGATTALYERTFADVVDRAWVVSRVDARAIRWLGGLQHVDVIPNGVDIEYFRPTGEPEQPLSAVFWGNLGFAPNIRGIEWFCSSVWPLVRRRRPSATLTIVGVSPAPPIVALSGRDGITVVGSVADLRSEVCRHAVAVMPFRSGSGLKNKMLEAAAMARPTVCTEAALNGLRGPFRDVFVVARHPDEWATRLEALWDDASERAAVGGRARRWVEENHTWRHAAELAMSTLQRGTGDRPVHRHGPVPDARMGAVK